MKKKKSKINEINEKRESIQNQLHGKKSKIKWCVNSVKTVSQKKIFYFRTKKSPNPLSKLLIMVLNFLRIVLKQCNTVEDSFNDIEFFF